jgi:hypothetical protein
VKKMLRLVVATLMLTVLMPTALSFADGYPLCLPSQGCKP